MSEHLDAVVVLAGEFAADLSDIGPGTRQRMDTAIGLVETEDVPVVVSGSHPFRWRVAPPHPLARFMRDYAVEQGVPASMIIQQDRSLDTIGDALFTKVEVTEPRDWRRLAVVTSDTHLSRSTRIFGHVMGPNYRIDAIGAGFTESVRLQRLQEFVGNTLVRAVLTNTEPGDTAAIQERLFTIIPGYAEVSTFGRVCGLANGLVAR